MKILIRNNIYGKIGQSRVSGASVHCHHTRRLIWYGFADLFEDRKQTKRRVVFGNQPLPRCAVRTAWSVPALAVLLR